MKEQICASAFVINEFDELLLIYHKKFGKYVQPGGHVEEDELPWQTAQREVFEETGIDVDIPVKEPFAKEIYENNVGHQIDYQYLATPLSTEIKHNEESYQAGWFRKKDLDNIPVVDDLKDKFSLVLQLKKKL